MNLYHNSFILPTLDGYVGGFQFGAVTNGVVTDILIHVFCAFLLGIHLEWKAHFNLGRHSYTKCI